MILMKIQVNEGSHILYRQGKFMSKHEWKRKKYGHS